MNSGIFIAAAFVTGALIPLQLAFNSQLGAAARSPFVAGLVVFLTGVAALALVVAVLRPAMPSLADMAVAPKTAWLGGIIATAYIVAIVTVTPRLGVGATTALILSGQLATLPAV